MTPDWRPAIRALIYCVQFEDDPTRAIDHALQTVVDRRALGLERSDYREAIANALASNEPLAEVVPQDHPEQTIRRYLELLHHRL